MSQIQKLKLSQIKLQLQEKLGNFPLKNTWQENTGDDALQTCPQIVVRIENERSCCGTHQNVPNSFAQQEFSLGMTDRIILWMFSEVLSFYFPSWLIMSWNRN